MKHGHSSPLPCPVSDTRPCVSVRYRHDTRTFYIFWTLQVSMCPMSMSVLHKFKLVLCHKFLTDSWNFHTSSFQVILILDLLIHRFSMTRSSFLMLTFPYITYWPVQSFKKIRKCMEFSWYRLNSINFVFQSLVTTCKEIHSLCVVHVVLWFLRSFIICITFYSIHVLYKFVYRFGMPKEFIFSRREEP